MCATREYLPYIDYLKTVRGKTGPNLAVPWFLHHARLLQSKLQYPEPAPTDELMGVNASFGSRNYTLGGGEVPSEFVTLLGEFAKAVNGSQPFELLRTLSDREVCCYK